MKHETKLFTVREVEGLTTLHETPRLYDWQARRKVVEIIERLDVELDQTEAESMARECVESAAESGAGRVHDGPTGVGVLVLGSSV